MPGWAPAGVVTWSWVSARNCRSVPGRPPKVTPVAPVRARPVRVTRVPPEIPPLVGITPVTTGRAARSYRNRAALPGALVPAGETARTLTTPGISAGAVT